MKGKEALAYARQLLFEQRIVSQMQHQTRLRLLYAIAAWRLYPGTEMRGTARLEAERLRWREEVDLERAKALERSRMDARRIEQLQARLDASEGVIAQLRMDNEQLRDELATATNKLELGGELDQLRTERSQRAAAGARAVLQEAAVRSRLDAEQRRLFDSSAQIKQLEALADEDTSALQLRQAAEERDTRGARDDAAQAFRVARTLGYGTGKLAWRAAYAHARLQCMWRRHETELNDLEERLVMLEGLRENRDALEWRVTQTKAQLIITRASAEGSSAQAVEDAFGIGHVAVEHRAGSDAGKMLALQVLQTPASVRDEDTPSPSIAGSEHSCTLSASIDGND